MTTRSYMQLACPNCSFQQLCGPGEMHRRLQQLGMLRREKEPDIDLLLELFPTAAERMSCPQCGHEGLTATPADDEVDEDWGEWGGQRECEICHQPIPAERLQVFPQATRCAQCQNAEERSTRPEENEYCPRCGSPMRVVLRSQSGLTRYVLQCSQCGK